MQNTNTKSCRLCQKILLKENFNKSKGVKDGLANECKNCRHEHRMSLKFERMADGTKYCNTCKSEKNVLLFHSNAKNMDGLESNCKKCRKGFEFERGSTFNGFITLLYKDLIHNAKTRNILVDITKQDIIDKYNEQVGLCNLTLFKMTHVKNNDKSDTNIKNHFNISVDRIDSSESYTNKNIQLVCSTINLLKGNMKQADFIDIMKGIADYKGLGKKNTIVPNSIGDLEEFKDIKHLLNT